ncbi:MAG: DNA polymerase II large subunit, partial [Candidatus Korarchaeota archaeon]|nr:DNA polymerase II large subunit [Candidatus Korarchaeota archaeon]
MSVDERYFISLEEDLKRVLEVAKKARAAGYDPKEDVEIKIANELHERIVALFNVESLGDRVKHWLEKTDNKVETAFRVIAEIIPRKGEVPKIDVGGDDEYRAELALRVGMAIITDATVSAPIEGISKVAIKGAGRDTYLSVYYNGPIRTAGGTEGAMSVLMADYVRQRLGLGRYVPTHEEVERYTEEVFLYKRVAHLQYNSEPEEVRRAVMHIPIEVTGPPTEKEEVSSFRNLPRVETNRIRGGAVLVINDCVIQKAKKLKRIIKQLKESIEDFDDSAWRWLGGDGGKEEGGGEGARDEGCPVVEPSYKYLKDAVMGRPILAHPSRIGGFRLRYGRSRNTGLASIGMNPATMYVLDSFVAVGTQVRIERPGKSAVVMPVDWIEGPIVRLRDGSVIKIDNPEQARELAGSVEKILHLGDVLIGFGEFLENNHKLLPSAWVEEWWYSLLREKAKEMGIDPPVERWQRISFLEALEISKKFDVPLHPRYTYFWEHVKVRELLTLLEAVREGARSGKAVSLRASEEIKDILERLGVPHRVGMNMLWVEGDDATLLDYLASKIPAEVDIDGISEYETLRFLNEHLDVKVMPKGPTKIGMRVGRPEKAKPRKMKPPVNLLFPIGGLKGMTRSMEAAYNQGKVEVEVAFRVCPSCGIKTTRYKCPKCGARTVPLMFCPVCGKRVNGRCRDHPNADPVPYRKTVLNIKEEVDRALSN